jgi:ankyrin repeat protein
MLGMPLAHEERRFKLFSKLEPNPGPDLPLLQACKSGDLILVKDLISKDIKTLGERGQLNVGPLSMAMIYGHFDVSMFLAEHGYFEDQPDDLNNTPICYAAFLRSPRLLLKLIERGSDPIMKTNQIITNHRPLHLAMLTGRADICQILLNHGASLKEEVRSGCNLMWSPLLCDKLESFEFGYSKDPTLIDAQDEHGHNCFQAAVKYGATRIVKWLIKLGKGDVWAPIPQTWSNSLHFASSCGSYELCCWIVKKYIKKEEKGKEQVSAESSRPALHSKAPTGDTPLLLAAAEGNLKCVQLHLNYEPLDTVCRDGANAMIWACGGGHMDVVLHLQSLGMSIFECAGHTWSPLMRAAANDRAELTEWLIEQGADMEKPDNNGYTCFLLACYFNRLESAKVLHKRGANVLATSKAGRDCVTVSLEEGSWKVFQWLYTVEKDIFCAQVKNSPDIFSKVLTKGGDKAVPVLDWLLNDVKAIFSLESLRHTTSSRVKAKDITCLKWLHDHGMNMLHSPGAPRSVIQNAISYNAHIVLEWLLNDLHAHHNLFDIDEIHSIVDLLVDVADERTTKLLLGPFGLSARDFAHINAVVPAATCGDLRKLKVLHEHGLDIHSTSMSDTLEAPAYWKAIPIFTAVDHAALEAHYDTSLWLLRKGVRFNPFIIPEVRQVLPKLADVLADLALRDVDR